MAERVELVTWNRKSSVMAESFRATLTSILSSGHTRRGSAGDPGHQPVSSGGKEHGHHESGDRPRRNRSACAPHRCRLEEAETPHDPQSSEHLGSERPPPRECALRGLSAEALSRKTHIPRLSFLPSGPGSANVSTAAPLGTHGQPSRAISQRVRRGVDRHASGVAASRMPASCRVSSMRSSWSSGRATRRVRPRRWRSTSSKVTACRCSARS